MMLTHACSPHITKESRSIAAIHRCMACASHNITYFG